MITNAIGNIPENILEHSKLGEKSFVEGIAENTGQMTDGERHFVSGMINLFKPENILELGVFSGGGTVTILDTIKDMDTKLTCVDILEYTYPQPDMGINDTKKIGHFALEKYPDLVGTSKWNLYLGKDFSEIADRFERKFDFLVLDTAHLHPIESLNFLSVLPFLEDGAIVIMHDISNFVYYHYSSPITHDFAPRILYSTVSADKYEPSADTSWHFITNICAFQISQHTRRYISGVFSGLYIPWEWEYGIAYDSLLKVFNEHYTPEQVTVFKNAVEMNRLFKLKKDGYININSSIGVLKGLPEDTIFYGAGTLTKTLLSNCTPSVPFNHIIWDKNAADIHEINGIPVTIPDFETKAANNQTMVVMIANDNVFTDIKKTFESLGYRILNGKELFF
jgi:predicted O-methyltransferase YrrM